MRIRWRGLELPSRVIHDETVSTERYGRFVVEPFEHGFGTTIGNSLRRILLSSIEGAAVTTVKIAGVSHEFYAMEGVIEDVTDIILNIKGIELTLDSDETKTMVIHRETVGEVKAGDIEADPAISIVNPDHHIATVSDDVVLHMDLTASRGRGYASAQENRSPEQELGVIPVDSIFSPVVRVRYRTEEMRVGQKTNYDRLIMEIWTRGSLRPEDALVEAGSILQKHLSPFVLYHELGEQTVALQQPEVPAEIQADQPTLELLTKQTGVLNLSVRASNCLEQAHISTIGELVGRTEADLLRVRSFGRTSLHEVQRKLADIGLSLGMKADQEGQIQEAAGPVSPAPEVHYPLAPPRTPILGDEPAVPQAESSEPTDRQPSGELEAGEPSEGDEQDGGGDGPNDSGTGHMQVFTVGE